MVIYWLLSCSEDRVVLYTDPHTKDRPAGAMLGTIEIKLMVALYNRLL